MLFWHLICPKNLRRILKLSRKSLRLARARVFQQLIDRSKTDPVGLETDLRRWQYIKAPFLLALAAWMFQEAVKFTFTQDLSMYFKAVSDYAWYVTTATLLIGLALYVFREKNKFYYGLIEVSFSIGLTYALVSHLNETGLGGALAVGGAIYVTVRGLDNMWTGYKSPRLRYKEEPTTEGDEDTRTPQ